MTKKPKPSASWPAANVEMRSLDSIKAYDKNPRTHPPEQIALLAASMRDDGVTMPILIDDAGVIIAGHGRRLGALANGFTEYPVVVAKGWSEEQKRAARIKDNSYGLMSGWDQQLIRTEIGNLKVAGFDVALLGFPETQLRQWNISVGTESEQDPDFVPERPKKPIVRNGDLWVLGEHLLLCGDCTKADDVAKVLGDERPNLMVTDPPYGVEYDANWRNEVDRANGKPYGASAVGKTTNDHRMDWTEAWKLFPGNVVYCWHAGRHASRVEASFNAAGFELRAQIIWAKTRLIISRGHYHMQHEPCWYLVRKGETANWQGDRSQTTLWTIEHAKSETGHSAQKPIECMKRPIENNSRKGDAIYEPFSGSGTTIVACEMTGRRVLAIEIDPGYVQVAIERWEKFTSRRATLAGKTLAQVAQARRQGRARKPHDAPKAKGRPTVAAPA